MRKCVFWKISTNKTGLNVFEFLCCTFVILFLLVRSFLVQENHKSLSTSGIQLRHGVTGVEKVLGDYIRVNYSKHSKI